MRAVLFAGGLLLACRPTFAAPPPANTCVDARPVTVAVLSSASNAPVAAAMEAAFLSWGCLRVVLLDSRSPTASNDVVAPDLAMVTAPDVDWW